MKLWQFVIASSVVLTGWLGYTFVHEVPCQRYPKLEKQTSHRAQPLVPVTAEQVKAGPEA